MLPNPAVSLGYGALIAGPGTTPSYIVSLSEDIVALVTYRARVAAARAEFAGVGADLLWRAWQMAQKARVLAFDIYFTDLSIALSRRELDLVSDELRRAQQATAAGNLALSALSPLLAAEAASEQSLAALRLGRLKDWQALDALLGLVPRVRFAIAAPDLLACRPISAPRSPPCPSDALIWWRCSSAIAPPRKMCARRFWLGSRPSCSAGRGDRTRPASSRPARTSPSAAGVRSQPGPDRRGPSDPAAAVRAVSGPARHRRGRHYSLQAQAEQLSAELGPARQAAAAARSWPTRHGLPMRRAISISAAGPITKPRQWSAIWKSSLSTQPRRGPAGARHRARPRAAGCGRDRDRRRAAAMKRRLLLAVACGALASAATGRSEAASSQPSVLVQLAKLKPGSLPQIVIAYGKVEPSAAARRTITAPLAAEIGRVYVRIGEPSTRCRAVAPGAEPGNRRGLYPGTVRAAGREPAQGKHGQARRGASGHPAAARRRREIGGRRACGAGRARSAGADGPHVLRAPFRAIVTGLSTSEGSLVMPGAASRFARPEGLVLRVGAVAAEAARIAPGDKVAITLLGERATASGTVLLRGSIVEPGSGLAPIKITLPPGQWLAGETAEAAITTGQLTGYVVPRQAVLVDDSGASYVVQTVNGTARKVPVRLLGAEGDRAVIDGPLDAAAPLVLAGDCRSKTA